MSSASFLERDLQTPNSATQIAQRLARDGVYGVDSWHRLRGRAAPAPSEPLRAFHLPAEPLYLATGFKTLPESSWRYLHVPITVLLIVAIAATAFLLYGKTTAVMTSAVALVDPFVLAHGPVWDDVFLAAMGEWAVIAVLFAAGLSAATGHSGAWRWTLRATVAICAAIAAAARLQSQILLAVIAALVFLFQGLRPARDLAAAAAVGAVAAVSGWTLRNLIVLGVVFPGSSHDGLTLFESNYEHARPAIFATGTAEGLSETHLVAQFGRVAALGEVEADKAYKAEAWQYIAAHPIEVVTTSALKVFVSVSGFDFARSATSVRNLVTVGSQSLIVLTGLAGLWWMWGRRANDFENVLFVLFLVSAALTIGMLVVGPVGMRYRISLMGFLYIGTGALLAQSWERLLQFSVGLRRRPRESHSV
ncbi:MAG: hypothetical protein ACRD2N_08055 [Vicinamibacterales bacterium]